MQEVRNDILSYAGSDLLYYRAGEPEGLVARQRELWDPILGWAEKHFGVRFLAGRGVMHIAQPEPALAAVRDEISASTTRCIWRRFTLRQPCPVRP
jgi:chaperone required for assembly of F1-ATPase